MATELKTDSWPRYMLYRGDEQYMTFKPEEARKEAAEAGKKFTASAYPDVWAKDAALVQRVRAFLAENFHWHDRLAKSGPDLDVIQTLMDMVRGGSVVVIPEEPVRTGSAGGLATQAASSFWGVDNYDATPYVSVKEQYQAQLQRINAERPTWAETQAMMDGINASVMRQMAGRSPLLDSLFDAAGWTRKYANTTDAPQSLLGDAQPFEYGDGPSLPSGDSELAWLPRTGGPANTWVVNPSGSGQMRLYDANGNAAVDFDFAHDHGFGAPHSHNWAGNTRDLGNAFSLLPY